MTDKDEMRKTVEEIWQEKIYNFDFSETGGNDDKIRIIDSGTDDAVASLLKSRKSIFTLMMSMIEFVVFKILTDMLRTLPFVSFAI
ncbi:hypothetical protein [Limosilactobacillus mucosae]|uniref:hypothetical protein n=1 Tax=Limosilactobacillus mucosae TaxID=97478 RepID=UPI003990E195